MRTARRRRKKSNSPNPENQVEVKKPKTGNDDKPMNMEQNMESMQPKCKTAKPIFIQKSLQEIRVLLETLNFSSRPLCRIRGQSSTQVTCSNLSDKNKFIEYLRKESIGFHTFAEPSDKHQCFVLKGFYLTSCDEMLSILKRSGVPAVKVSDLVRKDNQVIFIVHFVDRMNLNQLNKDHHSIDFIIVKWEHLKRPKNKVTQCFNCQQFGHNSKGCGYTSRCVKCDTQHPVGECQRKTQVGDPKCCNCGGNHSANHRGCPIYKKYVDLLISRTKKTTEIKKISKIETSQFPALPKVQKNPVSTNSRIASSELTRTQLNNHITYAEKLQEAVKMDNLYKRLTEAQEKLRKIPDIEKTINDFCKFVDELSEVPNNNSARFSLLLKYNIAKNENDDESSQSDEEMEDDYIIEEYDDSTCVKKKLIKGEEWMCVGRIDDLTESEKIKMKMKN